MIRRINCSLKQKNQIKIIGRKSAKTLKKSQNFLLTSNAEI